MRTPRVVMLGWWLLLAGLAVVLVSYLEEKLVGKARGNARGLLGLR